MVEYFSDKEAVVSSILTIPTIRVCSSTVEQGAVNT